MLFSFVRISYNQKSSILLRLVPFIKATLGAVAFITLAWLTQIIWRYGTFLFFTFVRISYNQKSSGLLRLVPFIKATLGAVAFITLAWLTQVIWRYATFLFSFWWLWSLWKLVYEVLINYVSHNTQEWHTGI